MKSLDHPGLSWCHFARVTTFVPFFLQKMLLPELCNNEFWLPNESLSQAWMIHSTFKYYKGNTFINLFGWEIFCNMWNIKPVRSKNKHTEFVLTTFAVVHSCFTFMNFLSPLSPPSFLFSPLLLLLPPFSQPLSFFLIFPPAPIQWKEECLWL